jgi:uridine phosphorylase
MKFFSDDPSSIVQAGEMVRFFTSTDPGYLHTLLLGGLALITFTSQDLRKLTAGEGIKRNASWRNRNNRIYTGEGWIVTQSPFGSPNAVMLLEELVAFGVRRAIFLGYCGSLQEKIAVGDVVVPIETVREEGTSYHYLKNHEKSLPDQTLQHQLFEWMDKIPLRVHRGKIWTTDAPYRETFKKVNHYREEGILGVDMEMSAVFALGMARHISVGGMLLVSDVLRGTAWNIGFRSPALKITRDTVIQNLLTHVREMIP